MTDFTSYFDEIKLPQSTRERITSALRGMQDACPEPFDEVFVGDQLDSEGQTTHTGLWAFSQRFVAESLVFMQSDYFEVTTYANAIVFMTVARQDYDLSETPTSKSRLSVRVALGEAAGFDLTMTATGQNCAALGSVLQDRFRNNLRVSQ